MATLGTFVAGQVLTAAELNAIGTWQTYTPTWTGTGGTPTIGNGTLTGKYMRINEIVFFKISLVWGSTTSASGITEWRFALPSGLSGIALFDPISMSGTVVDSGTATYRVGGYMNSATTLAVLANDSISSVGSTVPFTWTTNDRVSIAGFYEVA